MMTLRKNGIIAQAKRIEVAIATIVIVGIGLGAVQQITLRKQIDQYQQQIYIVQNKVDLPNISIKDKATLLKDIATLQKERITTENAIWTTLFQGLGGLFFLITVYFSWQNLQATQRNVEIAQQNLKATEDKQVAERFSKAVELLANENSIYARLGGIYALEKIANSDDSYYWPVMETLTAYVRERAKTPTKSAKPEDAPPLPVDIQAVLTVLSRRKYSYGNGERRYLNLCKTDLRGLQLSRGAKLSYVNLIEANLQKAEFLGVDLRGAVLIQADLQQATLREVKLQQAELQAANLEGADLAKAELQGAEMRRLEEETLETHGLTWKQLENATYVIEELPDYLLNNPPTEASEATQAK